MLLTHNTNHIITMENSILIHILLITGYNNRYLQILYRELILILISLYIKSMLINQGKKKDFIIIIFIEEGHNQQKEHQNKLRDNQ